MTAKKEYGEGREFFSEWHRDRYIADMEREALAGQARIDELEALGETDGLAMEQAKARLDGAKAELKRLGHGQKAAEKRPSGGKETR